MKITVVVINITGKMPVLIHFNFLLIFPEPNIDVLFEYSNT